MCKETISMAIYAEAKTGGDLWTYRPRSRRKCRQRYRARFSSRSDTRRGAPGYAVLPDKIHR